MREVKPVTSVVTTIADRCGLTKMRVREALQSDSFTPLKKRRQVLKMAQDLGYFPQGRKKVSSKDEGRVRPKVEVVLTLQLNTAFYSKLLMAIESGLAEHKYDCVIRTVSGEFEEFVMLCDILRVSPETPTLLVGYLPHQQLRTLLEARPHALLVDHTGDPKLALPYSSLSFDNVEASRMMVQHLLERGCQRILLLKGFADHYFSRDVEQGYRKAMAQASRLIEPTLIVETDFSAVSTVEKLYQTLDAGVSFDAVFTSDEMALVVLHTLHKKGLRVPDDVAVAGCDGLPFGRYTLPSLSTVVLDYQQLGRMAVEHILKFKSPPKEVTHRAGPLPRLEERDSTNFNPKRKK